MHGCNSGPTFLVNAEVDSMRGVVDCGDDKLLKASLSQAAIDKALADISHEIDFREERKKEIEFLEKGRDYLEFKPGNAASVSVQSTSLKEQHHKQIVTRFEAKGSFAVAASPHGGLVDSSAKPVVASISEPDTADNILLFNRENELAESKKRPLHSNRRDLVTLLEQPLKTVGSQNAKVPVNSAIFLSYARKNRSRPNHGPRGASRDGKGLISETNNQNVHDLSFVSKPKSAHLNDDLVVEDLTSNIQLDNELDHVKPNQTDDGRISGREGKLKITDNRSDRDDKCISPCQDDNAQNSATMASREANAVEVREPAVSDNHEPPPLSDTTKTQNEVCQPDDSGNLKVDRKNILGPQAAMEENADTPIDSANEDFILEAARIIEVKQKKIAELSIQKCPAENHMISHWGFVLEEMVWLANDFAQEHLWKISAAAQFCRLAAFRSQPRCGQQNKHWESKNLAHSMAKAIMQFWHSVEHSVYNDDPGCVEISVSVESGKELSKDSEGQCPGNIVCFKLLAYASRFLKYNNSLGISSHPYAVQTPERVSVSSDVDMSWDELHTEENLFYTVPPMAFDTYRKSVESHFLQWEKSGSGTQEEVETSLYDPSADADSEEIAYDEDEGETDAYYLHAQKKHRTMKSYAQEFRDQYTAGTRPSMQFGRKRDRLNFGSVPMKGKRRRMASRQRVVPTYAQRWKLDSVLSEQRGLSQKRSYGSSGLYRQHNGKKLKIVKPSFDNNLDNASLMTNSIPSLAASQMSYMSNLSKSFKTAKGRNAKTFMISSGQSVSGRPWSSFEEQAVLLLVHNLGPHWELISDAINSIFPLKYIFREPKECKEHYKFLMDDNAGDGADSAEDSESSYPCPSLICGIPKFERQVFHHFLGPMEEDTIKSHLEKIIKIGKKYDHHLNQNNNQAIKQIHIVDNSHFVALSQVFPNNLNGNVLTPRDFCDINSPAADSLPHGHQCSHARDLLLSNQGSVPSVLPTSGASSSLPGSSGMVHLNKLFSPSGPAGASSRFGVSRTLSVHEQQRVQQFSQVSSKNVKQSSVSVSGSLSGSERNVNMSSIKLNNQLVKQRHRQPQQQPQPQQHQQPGRQHYNPRQHPLPHHQTTVVKGIGGGSISLSRIPPMSQTADKGDKIMSHPQTAVSSKICSSGDLQLQSKGMNQNQPNVQRMLHLNFPLHSESSRKPQSDSMQAVQPSEHNASQVSTGTPVTPVQQSSSQPILSQHQYQLQEQHQEDQDQHSPKLGTSDCQPR